MGRSQDGHGWVRRRIRMSTASTRSTVTDLSGGALYLLLRRPWSGILADPRQAGRGVSGIRW